MIGSFDDRIYGKYCYHHFTLNFENLHVQIAILISILMSSINSMHAGKIYRISILPYSMKNESICVLIIIHL